MCQFIVLSKATRQHFIKITEKKVRKLNETPTKIPPRGAKSPSWLVHMNC